MRSLILLIIFFLKLQILGLLATQSVTINSHEYIRVADWAKENGFQITKDGSDKRIILKNKWAKIEIESNNIKARFNGILIWLLSAPVLIKNDIYISQLDVDKTISPIIKPPKVTAKKSGFLVVLDPGHGGQDPGNIAGANPEKKYTLLIAKELKTCLQKAGLKVILTRSTDKFIPLGSRPEIANTRKADLFISIHFNSIDNNDTSISGLETYCMTPSGASSSIGTGKTVHEAYPGNHYDKHNFFLAYTLHKMILAGTDLQDRGIRRARLMVLKESKVPCVLLELGYLSNKNDYKNINTPAWRAKVSQAITDGVLAYKKMIER